MGLLGARGGAGALPNLSALAPRAVGRELCRNCRALGRELKRSVAALGVPEQAQRCVPGPEPCRRFGPRRSTGAVWLAGAVPARPHAPSVVKGPAVVNWPPGQHPCGWRTGPALTMARRAAPARRSRRSWSIGTTFSFPPTTPCRTVVTLPPPTWAWRVRRLLNDVPLQFSRRLALVRPALTLVQRQAFDHLPLQIAGQAPISRSPPRLILGPST